jgi:tetratricopeptide (TPR) repeat protein
MSAVPSSPIAVLSAVNFVRTEEGRRDWRTYADRLVAKLPTNLRTLNADELAATGELRALVGELEPAAEAFERALRIRPGLHAVRLQLAKLRYEQKALADADRHAAEIVRSDPAGPFGDEARLLRTKIELMNSGGRRPGDSRAAQ